MKTRSNDKTYPCHVPDRPMDAPLLSFSLPGLIEKLKQEEPWKTGDRNAITLVKGEWSRIVLIALHGQSEIDFKKSGNIISVQLIEGKINFRTSPQSLVLEEGSLLSFHEQAAHTLIAVEDSVILLTIMLPCRSL